MTPEPTSRAVSLPLIITHSRVSALAACPRRHWWAYELGIRPETTTAALSIGAAFHAAVERMRRGASLDETVACARAAVADELEAELTACMISGWEWRWREAPLGRCLATEAPWRLRIGRGRAMCVVAGKIDAVYELQSGEVAVVENKTTREDISAVSDYWRRLNIDRQITWYIIGARQLGYHATTVIYDVARVPAMRPRLLSRRADGDGRRESVEQFAARVMQDIAERPDRYFARREIPRLDIDILTARDEMVQWHRILREHRRRGLWPRNSDACMRWGRCPYFGPCADGHDPMTQGVPRGYRVVDDVHAELAEETRHDDADQAATANE